MTNPKYALTNMLASVLREDQRRRQIYMELLGLTKKNQGLFPDLETASRIFSQIGVAPGPATFSHTEEHAFGDHGGSRHIVSWVFHLDTQGVSRVTKTGKRGTTDHWVRSGTSSQTVELAPWEDEPPADSVGSTQKTPKPQKKERATVAKSPTSVVKTKGGFVGTVGENITPRSVRVSRIYNVGVSQVVEMRDPSGGTLVWWTRDPAFSVGDTISISGRVVSHKTFRGVDQTTIRVIKPKK